MKDMTSYVRDLAERKGRVKGSCEWFLRQPGYITWNSEHGAQLLNVTGEPGIGKSAIAAFLVEHFGAQTMRPELRLAYFFCKNTDARRNTAVSLMRVLLFQLLETDERLYRHALEGVDRYLVRGEACFASLETVWQIFQAVLDDPVYNRASVIIIDGLDEIIDTETEDGNRERIVELLNDYVRRQSDRNPEGLPTRRVGIVVINQPIHRLRGLKSLSMDNFHHVGVTRGTVESDLIRYIDESLARFSVSWGPDLCTEVKTYLEDNHEGTFLWVSLVIRHLTRLNMRVDAHFAIRENLKNFPGDLDGVYLRILQDIGDDNAEYAEFILGTVVDNKFTLTTTQLATLLLFRNESNPKKFLPSASEVRAAKELLRSCDMLLRIDEDSEREPVKLLHQSVKEFLKNFKLPPKLSHFQFDEKVARARLSSACISYMCTQELQAIATDAMSLAKVVDNGNIESDNDVVFRPASSWTLAANTMLAPIEVAWKVCQSDGSTQAQSRIPTGVRDMLGDAAMFSQLKVEAVKQGWHDVVRILQILSRASVAKSTSLEDGIAMIRELSSEQLLDYKILYGGLLMAHYMYASQPKDDRHAIWTLAAMLAYAILKNDQRMLQAIVRPADFHDENYSWTVKALAVVAQQFESVKERDSDRVGSALGLLVKFAKGKSDEHHGTLLHCTAFSGSSFVVASCMQHGYDVMEKGNNGMTALHYAVYGCQPQCVSAILTSPSALSYLLCPNSAGELPIHNAAQSKDPADEKVLWILDLLIRADTSGKTLTTPDQKGKIPLHHAVETSRQDRIALLVRCGRGQSTLDIEDDHGVTPRAYLMTRLSATRKDLLRHFQDLQMLSSTIEIITARPVAAVDETHTTCSRCDGQISRVAYGCGTCDEGRFELCEQCADREGTCDNADHWLLKHFHVHGRDSYNRRMQPSTESHRLEPHTCRTLTLSWKERVSDDLGRSYRKMIYLAAEHGLTESLATLFDMGVDINAPDEAFGNILQAASYWGHEQLVQMVISRGADVNAEARPYGTALGAASHGGHDAIVKLLLDSNANANAISSHNRTVLSEAAYEGRADIVQLLLGKGADMDLRDQFGRSARSWAAMGGHRSTIEIMWTLNSDSDAPDAELLRLMSCVDGMGCSLLHHFTMGAYIKGVKWMLDHDFDINVTDSQGWSALHWGLYKGPDALDVVQELLPRGISQDLIDSKGRTAWDVLRVLYSEVLSLICDSCQQVGFPCRQDRCSCTWSS